MSKDETNPPALLDTPSAAPGLDASLLATTLDEIACGILILDAHGRLLHCNVAGQMHINRAKHLRQQEQGLIEPTFDKDVPNLQAAMAKALQGKRSMLNLGVEKPASVAVVPLDRRSGLSSTPASSGKEPRIALIFSRSGMCENLMLNFFSSAYQLTHMESQVLAMLCVGQSAPEMAQELRIGEATVRTHIRSICQKTQSHGIREVVKRLALLPPLMAAVMPSAFA